MTAPRQPNALSSLWGAAPSAIDLRCGEWRVALADVTECDVVITDVPYSERTIKGQRSGGRRAEDGWQGPTEGAIRYRPWTESDANVFCAWVLTVRPKWLCVFCDHVIFGWLEEKMAGAGWVTFQPVPWVKNDAAPKMVADGPSPQSETLFVARPRGPFAKAYRPGWYQTNQDRTKIVTGSKPLNLMRAVVGDYTLPGWLVVDPHAGGATTLIAAAELGCRAIGAEMDPKTFALAQKRIARGYTPLPHPRAGRGGPKPKQGALW